MYTNDAELDCVHINIYPKNDSEACSNNDHINNLGDGRYDVNSQFGVLVEMPINPHLDLVQLGGALVHS